MITVGQELVKYRIEKRIGRGRFGRVYRAVDQLLQDVVAIKEIEIEAGAAKPILAEARLMRGLKNQHILSLWDVIVEDEYVYLVMEYAAGGTLRERLNQPGQLEAEQVIEISRQICAAVAYAHDQDVMHRD